MRAPACSSFASESEEETSWVMSMQRHIPCGAPECFHGPRVILCNPNKAKAVNKMQAASLLCSNWRLS